MTLSDQQMAAVHAGEPRVGWRRISPTLVPVPSSILNLTINDMIGWGNSPEYTVTVAKLPDFRKIPYHYSDRRYTAIDPDTGLLSIYRHGPLMEIDGVWQTDQGEGFGGRHFPILMQDGRRAVLRGPWHGVAPLGTVEVYVREDETRSYFGYFLPQSLFFSVAHKFAPERQPCIVSNAWGERAELGSPLPKGFTAEEEMV